MERVVRSVRAAKLARHVAAFAVMGGLLVAFPHSARSGGSAAGAAVVALGAVGTIACWTVLLADEDREPDTNSYARTGWVAGAAGTYAADFAESDAASSLGDAVGSSVKLSLKNSFGLQARAGYRCHRRFSAEAELEWLSGFEGKVFEESVGTAGSIEYEPLVVTANAKGYILTGRYQPFLLAGAGLMKSDTTVQDDVNLGLPRSDSPIEFAMRLGGGLDFYATKRVVLTLEADYVLPFGDLEDLDYLSIGWGLQYRF